MKIDLSAPQEVHPLALEAYKMFVAGDRSLSPQDLAELKAKLDGIADLTELWRASVTLGATALYLEQLGSTASREALLDLLKTQAPRFLAVKDDLNLDVQDQAQAVAAQFSKLAATFDAAAKTAPMHGAKAPKGSIPLHGLMPNPALRPPPKRSK